MSRCKLGDLIDVTRGTSLQGKNYSEEGKLIRLTLGNFDSKGGFKENTAKKDIYYIGNVKKEFILQKGDMITPLTEQTFGLLGSMARIPESNKYIQSQDIGLIKCKKEKIEDSFCYYLISSNLVRKQLSAAAQQTKIRHTSPDKIKDVIVDIPELDYQKKAGKILDYITYKIENNNKINEELESMAKTIYDYWFLQFEFPNEEGKPYKSSGGKMVWNEELKREIPEGWECKKLKQCIQHINTGLNPRNNFVLGKGNIKYITVKNITENGTLDFLDCDTIDETARKIINKRSNVSKGDILFASIAPLGRCFLVQENPYTWDINESVFSIRPDYKNMTSEYLYMYLISPYFIKKAEYSSTGSVFNGIRISTLENVNILVPSSEIMIKFKEKISNLLYVKHCNELESNELAELRDFLLPLLMNGQVRFRELVLAED